MASASKGPRTVPLTRPSVSVTPGLTKRATVPSTDAWTRPSTMAPLARQVELALPYRREPWHPLHGARSPRPVDIDHHGPVLGAGVHVDLGLGGELAIVEDDFARYARPRDGRGDRGGGHFEPGDAPRLDRGFDRTFANRAPR